MSKHGARPVGEVRCLLDRDALITPPELAEYLAVPPGTLRQWRYLGVGPRALKVGRHARYDPAEVRRWLTEECRPPGQAA